MCKWWWGEEDAWSDHEAAKDKRWSHDEAEQDKLWLPDKLEAEMGKLEVQDEVPNATSEPLRWLPDKLEAEMATPTNTIAQPQRAKPKSQSKVVRLVRQVM
jgi:hypothetical protein